MLEEKKSKCLIHRCGSKRMERFLVPSLLLILAEGNSYGYELAEKYSEIGFTDSGHDFGAIYRTLNMLEKMGFINSSWEISKSGPAKKNYSITNEGMNELENWVEFIKKRDCILKLFLERFKKLQK